MEYDDVLKKTGEFGFYQKKIYFIVCLVAFPAAFNGLGYVFWASRPEHWCHVHKSVELGNISDAVWKDITIPVSIDNGKHGFESCVRYNDDYILEKLENISDVDKGINVTRTINGSNNNTVPCDSWDYDRTQYKSSIVTKYGLVCGRQWLISASQSAYMACRMIGTMGLAFLADRFGRRKIILLSIFAEVFSAFAIAFAPGIYTFIAFRCICAIFSTGSFQTVYVLVMELVGPGWRVLAGTVIMLYWAVGYILLAAIAYFIRDHFTLQIVLSVPFVLLFLFYWIVPESPRWLAVNGKKEEVEKIIKAMAKANGTEITNEVDLLMASNIKDTMDSSENSESCMESLKHGYIWKMIAVLFSVWFANALVYYGLSMNSSDLGGNDYFNFFISGAVEIPAYILCYFTFRHCGRQLPLLALMILAGMSLLATGLISPDQYVAVVALVTSGKFFITCTYSMIYIYTIELFPTTVRNTSLGLFNTVARIGGALAPFAAEINQSYPGLPLIIFGILASASGVMVLTLPETKDKPLPQTMKDGEILAHQPNIITRCCKSQSKSVNSPVDDKEETIM